MKKKFLVISKIDLGDEFVPNNVIPAGDWCVGEPNEYKKYTLWNNVVLFTSVRSVIDSVYEKALCMVADYLNSVHAVRYGNKFWRILLGPWLYRFICVVTDKYLHLENICIHYNDLWTRTLSKSDYRRPTDTKSFREMVQTHLYNYQIISDLIPFFKISVTEADSYGRTVDVYYQACIETDPCDNSKGVFCWHNKNNVHICVQPSILLGSRNLKKEKLNFMQYKYFALESSCVSLTEDFIMPINVDIGNPLENKLITVLSKILPQYIPLAYTAGFKHLLSQAGQYCATYVIGDYWHENEPFKFIAANAKANNGIIVAINPGGVFGVYDNEFVQQHEVAISDYVLSRNPYPGCCLNDILPTPKKTSTINLDGGINVIYLSAGFYQPYISDFQSIPTGNYQIYLYFQTQLRFFSLITKELKESLVYRPHPTRENKQYTARICEMGIQKDSEQQLYKTLLYAKLVIIDHFSSALIEILAQNIPFILYINQKMWRVSHEVQSIIELLKQVGVACDNIETVASLANTINRDPLTWWREPVRQLALQNVKKKAIRETNHFDKHFINLLDRLANNRAKL